MAAGRIMQLAVCGLHTPVLHEDQYDTYRDKSKYWQEEPLTSANLSATNLTLTDLASNFRFSVEMPRTDRLSYGTAYLKTMVNLYHI
jgi:hypothetical protein